MKKSILIACLSAALPLSHAWAVCTTDPTKYTGRMVAISGGHSGETGRTLLAGFYGYYDSYDGTQHGVLNLVGALGGWNGSGFDVSKITDRVVSGDFDDDGLPNEVAAFYDEGGSVTSLRTWSFVDGSPTNYNPSAWTSSGSGGYDATKITGRVVSGDFDSDGFFDDIAAFYDYGSGHAKIHVWLSNGSTFNYSWWWDVPSGYYSNLFTGRVVAGDFDRDNYYDDIAVLYDYGGGAMRIHVFKGMVSSFSYSGPTGWWSVGSGYSPTNISFRVASGNFDHSGVLTNHRNDDIVAIYDYGSGVAKAHVWTSTGTGFNYSWKWEVTGFIASNITDRFVSMNTNIGDNVEKSDRMAALYNYGSATDVSYQWEANHNNPWNFGSTTKDLCPPPLRVSPDAPSTDQMGMTRVLAVNAFPNPSDGHVTVEIAPTEGESVLTITDLSGRQIYAESVNTAAGYRNEIDISEFGKGVYLLQIVVPGLPVETKKLIVN